MLNKKVPEGKIAVYRHLKPNGEVFYIGVGKGDRPYVTRKRSKFWKDTVAKYGYEVQILTLCDNKDDALELEKVLISYYGRRDLGTGTLVNLTDGGEYFDGFIRGEMTQEQRDAVGKANRERIHSDETRQKLKDHYQNVKVKLLEAALKANYKPIVQLTLDGEFVREWDTQKEVVEQISVNPIYCLRGRSKTAGGYLWKYKSDYETT